MNGFKLLCASSAGLVLASALPFAGATADPVPIGASSQAEALRTGRSVHKARRMHRPTPGSYTNGVPDGANTGSRRQTPTGGNPGSPNHS